jgi:MATE family multidrug resistance protein
VIAPASGRIEVSHRRILVIALPMTLAHITTPLLGLVDATIVGRLGEAHLLGAVALGAIVFDFLFWSFGALRLGTAGLTAQAKGAGDAAEIDLILSRALVLSGLVGLVLVVLQTPLASAARALTGPSEAVAGAFATYFTIRIWAAPFTLANYVILGSALGRARTDLGLVLQLGINAANIALSVFLVMGLGLGIAGAALGTVLAEIFGTALGVLVLRRLGSRPFAGSWTQILDRKALARTLAVNRDIMIRTAALLTALALFTSQGARSGDLALAANAVLYNLVMVGSYLLDGLATAAGALCGQAVGARDEGAFRRAVRLSLMWSMGIGAAVSLLLFAAGPPLIAFITTNEAVRVMAGEFLVMACLVPALGAAGFAFDGIYVGATWNRAMRDLMLGAVAAYVTLLWATSGLGNTGLWLAFLTFTGARSLGQAALYPRLVRRTFADGSSDPPALERAA